ncbi:hypothetical protein PGTUg99_032464 [Puccinia graminis f. sp. tritici]|uniref:GH26 domain-containing protein n=1 Tax=Puccinia graminis f. sp. tritici TaxID=56615 RepID=A0A5B0NJV9_PUCGR|nr:hypothetical protein PGTUg99_032464 [Puccinia graminis f. sp. tritici]
MTERGGGHASRRSERIILGWPMKMLATNLLLLLTVLLLTGGTLAQQDPAAPAPSAPPRALNEHDGVYFGIWPDTAHGFSDTPAMINQRLGFNTSVFQIAQLIPLPTYNYTTGAGGPAPEYLIEQTQTDAAVFLTVYPTGLDVVTDDDLKLLGVQLQGYTEVLNRTVFLRFGPEMQGQWNPYGFQPTKFLALWRRMYSLVKAAAPRVAVVWAPNTPQSYPYGQLSSSLSPEDLALLDTDHDGKVSNTDDPFSPYYPGDDQVDWIGLSTYYKGPNFQNINVAQPSGYCSSVMNGTSPTSTFNWYEMYCTKPGKACMIAESGAAFHVDALTAQASTARSIVDLQRAWWQDCITSPTLVQAFPRLKLHMHFEHVKLEMDGGKPDLRDYRLSNDTTTLEAFKQDFSAVSAQFVVASFRALPAGVPPTGRPSGSPNSPVPVVPGQPGQPGQPKGIVFQTQRNPVVTGPPTLFGSRRSNAPSSIVNSGLLLLASSSVLLHLLLFPSF